MIDLNHNRACELSEAKHDKNIIFNYVRFSRFAGQAIIQLKSNLYYDEIISDQDGDTILASMFKNPAIFSKAEA